MTRVFEDLDLPGDGQPFRLQVDVALVDASTLGEVREAYYNGRTIVGSMRAPVDGSPAQWNQGLSRAQWRLDLAPNNDIVYQGSPGGTLWKRTIQSQSASRRNKIKKSVAYIEVPDSLNTLLFGDLVVSFDGTPVVADHTWEIVQGDDWNRTLTVTADAGASPEDYTFELELRRSLGSSVVAEVVFDYSTVATDGNVAMSLPRSITASLIGTYVGKLQQFDPDGQRSTQATWAFVITRDG